MDHRCEVFAVPKWVGIKTKDVRSKLTDQSALPSVEEARAQIAIDGASVHPREVVKAALRHNAAACIFAHNHPSGDTTPSRADQQITQRLKEVLGVIDVRTLDHVVVSENTCSFAEMGML